MNSVATFFLIFGRIQKLKRISKSSYNHLENVKVNLQNVSSTMTTGIKNKHLKLKKISTQFSNLTIEIIFLQFMIGNKTLTRTRKLSIS